MTTNCRMTSGALRALGLLSLVALVGCDEPESVDVAPVSEAPAEPAEQAAPVDAEWYVVSEFEASWDPASQQFDIAELAPEAWVSVQNEGLRGAIQPLYCPVRVGGVIALETVPGSLQFNAYDCGLVPVGDPLPFEYETLGTFCATIGITNRRAGDYETVYAQIVSVEPDEGYNGFRFPYGTGVNPLTVVDAENKPSDTLGLWSFGELRPTGVDGDSATSQWVFENAGGVFSFRGQLIAAVRELPDGIDNDCDGRIDDGIQQYAAGEDCIDDLDCVSALCDGGVCAPSCTPGFFGVDCLSECPGGATNACFGNGECFDDAGGDGSCTCDEPWGGASCDECDDSHWGANCANRCDGDSVAGVCNGRGTCDSGISGSGDCACDVGFHGEGCAFSCFDGERNGEEVGTDCGAVCGVECWGNEIKFTAFDVDIRKQFSWSIAADGDTLLAGAVGEAADGNNNAGAVYFYDYVAGQYVINERFSPPVVEELARFGYDVAVDGDLAVVSAPFETVEGLLDAGAVYVYERGGTGAWQFSARLTIPDFTGQQRNNLRLGFSVATDGTQIFAGVPNYACCDVSGNNRNGANGAVFVFGRDGFGGWALDQIVTVDHIENSARLGEAIAVDGARLVVGRYNARHDLIDETRRGDAILFSRDVGGTWVLDQALTAAGLADGDRYGQSVAIDGDAIAISARRRDTVNGTNTGSVFAWRWDGATWSSQELIEPNGRTIQNWGWRVDVDGDYLFVAGGGRVYVFEYDGTSYVFRNEYGRPPGPAASGFGGRVAVTPAGRVLVGAQFNSATPDRGTVFVYDIETDDSLTFTQRVIPLNVQVGDSFGWVVAMDEERVVAGAFGEDVLDESSDIIRTNAGAAYVFRRDQGVWSDEAKLVAPDFAGNDQFGAAIDIDGDLVVVSAPLRNVEDSTGSDDSDAGAVFLYRFDGTTWNLAASIESPLADDQRYLRFGTTVAVGGNTVFVGGRFNEQPVAPADPLADPPQCLGNGFVLAYALDPAGTPKPGELEAWAPVALPDLAPGCFAQLGGAMDVEGDRVAIGASGWGPANRGSVFILDRVAGQWVFTARLFRQTGAQNNEYMGFSVDLSGDVLAAGAVLHDERGGDGTGPIINGSTGRVHLFRFDGGIWTEGPVLSAPGIEANARLGQAVGVEDDIVVAGAIGVDGLGFVGGTLQTLTDAGAVYVFRDTGGDAWVIERTIVGTDIDDFDQFGRSVSIEQRRIAVGAVFEDILDAEEAGAAYVYE